MARRRSRLSGALAGLGEGITNAGDILLRTMMQDRLQERYDRRAAENAKAVATRQQELDLQNYIETLNKEVAEGGDPSSAARRLSMRKGQPVGTEVFEGSRPSPRRRMEKAVGGDIAKATSPEMVPGDLDIASIARSEGIGERFPNLPAFATEGMEPASGAFADLDPIAAEYGQRGAQRRSALESRPTKQVSVMTPTGEERTEFVSEYGGPITTKPDAATQGRIKGVEKTAEIGASGAALASQAGLEAGARTRAQLAAELAQAGITGQQQTAALTLADDYAKASGEFTATKNAVSSIVTLAKRIESARAKGQDAPAAHIGMVFNFMKMQDPASTVREGEQAMAQNAAGVDERVRNIYNSLIKGGRLSPEQVRDFTATAADVYRDRAVAQKRLEEDYTQRAITLRVPPKLVTGYASMLEGGPQSALDKLRGGQ